MSRSRWNSHNGERVGEATAWEACAGCRRSTSQRRFRGAPRIACMPNSAHHLARRVDELTFGSGRGQRMARNSVRHPHALCGRLGPQNTCERPVGPATCDVSGNRTTAGVHGGCSSRVVPQPVRCRASRGAEGPRQRSVASAGGRIALYLLPPSAVLPSARITSLFPCGRFSLKLGASLFSGLLPAMANHLPPTVFVLAHAEEDVHSRRLRQPPGVLSQSLGPHVCLVVAPTADRRAVEN